MPACMPCMQCMGSIATIGLSRAGCAPLHPTMRHPAADRGVQVAPIAALAERAESRGQWGTGAAAGRPACRDSNDPTYCPET